MNKMRNRNVLAVVAIVAVSVFMILSCKKKSEDPQPQETPVTPPVGGAFTARINGSIKSFPANFYSETGIVALSIAATETGGTGISLAVFSTTIGSNDIDGTLTTAYYYVGSNYSSAASGKIVISKLENNKISGTFNFTITGVVTATEGVFTDVPLK